MKYASALLILCSLILVLGCKKDKNEAPESATYMVTFTAFWSSQTHPTDFPSNAHFSPLIGMTHNSTVQLFEVGTLASAGIKNMAETGSKSPLDDEINSLINAGDAYDLFSDDGSFSSPGTSHEVQFKATKAYPYFSVVSMIAPSPDWFVGVKNINLIENGSWVDERIDTVGVYDAGTDSGASFASPNQATNPFQNISPIISSPLGANGVVAPMGIITIRREK